MEGPVKRDPRATLGSWGEGGQDVMVVGVPCVAITVTWPSGAEGDDAFLTWALHHDVFPVVRGGYSGAAPHRDGFPLVDATRREHMGFYSPADAERIREWAKR